MTPFTGTIQALLVSHFREDYAEIFTHSQLLQYIGIKTKSANKGSKSRSNFANLYAIYVLVEDYLKGDFQNSGKYSEYDGAKFSDLFTRQRQLPFGAKLQNHALNSRMNDEFKKYFPTCEHIPIIRLAKTNRYWINEHLIKIEFNEKSFNIAPVIIQIINAYIDVKRDSFEKFIKTCQDLIALESKEINGTAKFIMGLLEPNVDARIFEIVSFSILKYYYFDQIVYFGFDLDDLTTENLKLYKTGRTNANDGGIDFVMKPLGKFFQVTETTDVRKYFLDIDKLEKFPITFVVKSTESKKDLIEHIKTYAIAQYPVNKVVEKYMACIEEIINIPELLDRFNIAIEAGNIGNILSEIIIQSKVEFNYDETIEEGEDSDEDDESGAVEADE